MVGFLWLGKLIVFQVSASLVWKKAQRNDTKNNTSDTINKIIPYRNPFVTIFVCNLWYVPSRVTSHHH